MSLLTPVDFVVVSESCYSAVSSGSSKLLILRAFRALRPLRTVQKLPELKQILDAFITSIPQLLNSLVLFAFFFLVFGLIAMQFWMGNFRNVCFSVETVCLSCFTVLPAVMHASSLSVPRNLFPFFFSGWTFSNLPGACF